MALTRPHRGEVARQAGGRVYGEGVKGKTYNAAPGPGGPGGPAGKGKRVDTGTLAHDLRSLERGGQVARVVLYGPGVRPAQLALPGAAVGRLATVVERHGGGLVAKHFRRAGATGRDDFMREVLMGARVAAAYEAGGGRGAADRYTTLGATLRFPAAAGRPAFPFVGACLIGADGGTRWYSLSRKCDGAVTHVRFDDATLLRLVGEVTESLRLLHGGGLLHADLKADNMVACSLGTRGPRFRFIDWEMAIAARDLQAGLFVSRPCFSPMFWYCWGLPAAGAVAVTLARTAKHAPACARGARTFSAAGAEYHARVGRATLEFEAHLATVPDMTRADLMRRHWTSFDGFNFGIMLLGVLVDRKRHSAVTPAVRAQVHTVIDRLLSW
jgi:hypothetical protein